MLHYGPSDGVDPILLFLLGIGDEVHGIGSGGEFESVLSVEDVFGALDCKASGHGDDATWLRDAGDG